MSQAKVDRYKEEKANRRKNIKKEKMKHAIRNVAVGIVSLALVGWLGYSAYNIYDSKKPVDSAQVDYTAITEYQNTLFAD